MLVNFSHWAFLVRLMAHFNCYLQLVHVHVIVSNVVWDRRSWDKTGLRPKNRSCSLHTVVLVLQVWCCVVKHGLVTLVLILILKDKATFQVLYIVSSLFCAWNITTVEWSGIHLLKSLIRQVLMLTSGGLGLVTSVLVLRIWSCLHHWLL